MVLTLPYLENLQKDTGDLLLSLYYDDGDNASIISSDYLDSEYESDSSIELDDYEEINISDFIEQYENKKSTSIPNFKFNSEQKEAIIKSVNNKFIYLLDILEQVKQKF